MNNDRILIDKNVHLVMLFLGFLSSITLNAAQKPIKKQSKDDSVISGLNRSNPINIVKKFDALSISDSTEDNEITSGSASSSFDSSSDEDSFELWRHQDQLELRSSQLKKVCYSQDPGGVAFLAIQDVQAAESILPNFNQETREIKDLKKLIVLIKADLCEFINTLHQPAQLRLFWCLAAPVLKVSRYVNEAIKTLINQLVSKKYYKKDNNEWYKQAFACTSIVNTDIKLAVLNQLKNLNMSEQSLFYVWVLNLNKHVQYSESEYERYAKTYTMEAYKHTSGSSKIHMPQSYCDPKFLGYTDNH